jgi:hypothetical protein
MKKKLLKGLFYLLLGYVALVILRFLYLELGGTRPNTAAMDVVYREHVSADAVQAAMKAEERREKIVDVEMPSSPSEVRNFASMKIPGQDDAAGEQKYEKIGSLRATTESFDDDQQKSRAIINAHNALIQEEAVNKYGDLNHLDLTIGIPPGEFEATVADLKHIGKLTDFQVTKTDKTNDYRQLMARRASLEKTRDALIALKSQGGKIEELVKLEQEVLSLENKIQTFGVQLGQFDKVNEFCTVRFSLGETRPEVVRAPHFDYLMASIEWASSIYLLWLGIACVGLVAIILLFAVAERSKLFRADT